MKKLVFIILLIVLYKYVFPGEILHTPGILVKEEPIQIQNSKELPNKKGWKFTAFASYTISGRVLGRNRYYSGPSADIAPVDIALGWNKMSDTAVIEKLNISMGNRFYFYQWSGIPPIPQYEIQCSSANNHMIAANSEIESRIKSLKVGELCTFMCAIYQIP